MKDKRVLKLIRVYLSAGAMENGFCQMTEEGTPQGGPLSPLLANILLDDLERELHRRGLRFVRYADDCNIFVASKRAGRTRDGVGDTLCGRKAKTESESEKERRGPAVESQVSGL